LSTENLADQLTILGDRPDTPSFVPVLRTFDERITDLSVGYSISERQPTVSVKIEGVGGLPIQSIGDGLRRLVDIMVTVPLAKQGLGLIDEIESGVYFENLRALWSVVDRLSRESNVQVFATTHSWECVSAAHRALGERSADLRIHRLERHTDKMLAFTYPPDLIEAAVEDRVEVR
jgi:hypothetical protein